MLSLILIDLTKKKQKIDTFLKILTLNRENLDKCVEQHVSNQLPLNQEVLSFIHVLRVGWSLVTCQF